MSTAWHLAVLDGGILIKKETEKEAGDSCKAIIGTPLAFL